MNFDGLFSRRSPSIKRPRRQMPRLRRAEQWAEAERNQIPLWTPVLLGAGIAAWFVLPDPRAWGALMLAVGGVGLAAATLADGGRVMRAVGLAAVLVLAGILLAWARAESVRAPVLARPLMADMVAEVDAVEPLAARQIVRLMLRPVEARTDVGMGCACRRVSGCRWRRTIRQSDWGGVRGSDCGPD